MSPRTSLLIDCDPGVDDAIALLTAASLADVIGITTVNGNVGIEHTTRNALAVLEVAGLDIPVHRGAEKPLAAAPADARHVHGETGLGTIELPDAGRSVASDDAVGFILDAARTVEGLHLLAVGPLTNVAEALRRDPTLPARLAGVTIMGGGVAGGNVTASAEFNIWADPEAADIVFTGADVTMVGLDVTHQVPIDASAAEQLRETATPAADLAAQLLEFAGARAAARGFEGAIVHDAYAVIAVTHPHLFGGTRNPVAVELDGAHTRGMTVVDTRHGAAGEGRTHHVLRRVDATAVVTEILDAITGLEA